MIFIATFGSFETLPLLKQDIEPWLSGLTDFVLGNLELLIKLVHNAQQGPKRVADTQYIRSNVVNDACSYKSAPPPRITPHLYACYLWPCIASLTPRMPLVVYVESHGFSNFAPMNRPKFVQGSRCGLHVGAKRLKS
jgi:hypothetical protein